MASGLSQSMEDYLEVIAELIAVNGHAHTKEIAERLKVKLPSVTGALRQLSQQNYIIYNSRYPVQLTPEGKAIADGVIHRHQVLKQFFSVVLGLSAEQASETACHLEHVVDSRTIERFVLFSEAISNRSDARRLQIYLTEAMALQKREETRSYRVLTHYPAGEALRIVKFGRNLDHNAIPKTLKLGDRVVPQGLSLDKRFLSLQSNAGTQEIPVVIAENIWAEKL